MASAKRQAQSYLGNENDYINLKGLNEERQLANDVYNTNTKSFQNAYNDLLNTIASNRTKAKTDFGSGRSTVSENAYLQNRNNIADSSARGLGNGVAQLNKLGNRMETGRQFSDLANTYYNTLNELNANEKTYTNEYNTNINSNNQYNTNIDSNNQFNSNISTNDLFNKYAIGGIKLLDNYDAAKNKFFSFYSYSFNKLTLLKLSN